MMSLSDTPGERAPNAEQGRGSHLVLVALAFLFCASFLGLLAFGLRHPVDTGTNALVGKKARDFEASWISGQGFLPQSSPSGFTLSDFGSRPLIVNFWASWCVSCRAEASLLEAFWQKHKDEGVGVVGVAIQDSVEEASKFAERMGKSYPLGLDVTGRASIDYGVVGVPETFFIDSNGMIQYKITGPVDRKSLAEGLARIGTQRGEG